ncbi:ermin isoform X2 [Hemicordylus capensis]|uniref:ermin isoform X2 n=1 Tax=Hemicordylus capensis TaxID=884348 RepID=UPI00230289EF|nr:ermin isoform X2 [Hemicordylus capensis]
MTEDIPVPASIPEYNRNVPSEKPQLQVIDIIDQIANSVEIFPYESTEPGSPFIQGNQEEANHLVENAAYEVSGKEEGNKDRKSGIFSQETRDWGKESGKGLCEDSSPGSTEEHEVSEQEEMKAQQPCEEKAYCTNEMEEDQEGVQLCEPVEKIQEETSSEVHENATEGDLDGTEEGTQKESNGAFHKKEENGSKEFLPMSPSCNSPIEKCDEQTSSVKKNDISRHSYSRYNTISYRKIRKGNTKQRIDEFESMMHS